MATIRRNIFLPPRRGLPLGSSLFVGLAVGLCLIFLPQLAALDTATFFEPEALAGLVGAVVVFCFLYRFWPNE